EMTIANTLLDPLGDRDLLAAGIFVAGQWHERADNGQTFKVTNPSTGELLATLPDAGFAEARAAIDAAHRAQAAWAAKTGKERAGVLRKLHELMVAAADDLAAIMTAEQGKPLAEARGEVLY